MYLSSIIKTWYYKDIIFTQNDLWFLCILIKWLKKCYMFVCMCVHPLKYWLQISWGTCTAKISLNTYKGEQDGRIFSTGYQKLTHTPGWVAQLIRVYCVPHKVVGVIPSQATYGRQLIDVSVSVSVSLCFIFSVSFPLSLDKTIKTCPRLKIKIS